MRHDAESVVVVVNMPVGKTEVIVIRVLVDVILCVNVVTEI